MLVTGSYFNAVGPERIANSHGQTEQDHDEYTLLHDTESEEVRVLCTESVVVRSAGPSGNWVQNTIDILLEGEEGEGTQYERSINQLWGWAKTWDDFTEWMEKEIESGVVFSSPL